MDGWMHGWMDGWMNEWMDECMDGWMDRYLYIFPNNILSSCPYVEAHKKPTPNVRKQNANEFMTWNPIILPSSFWNTNLKGNVRNNTAMNCNCTAPHCTWQLLTCNGHWLIGWIPKHSPLGIPSFACWVVWRMCLFGWSKSWLCVVYL